MPGSLKKSRRRAAGASKKSLAPSNRDQKSLGRLNKYAKRLEPDAVDLLAFIAQRLVIGRQRYGNLDLKTDGRDFRCEAREELGDMLVYLAAMKMQEDL